MRQRLGACAGAEAQTTRHLHERISCDERPTHCRLPSGFTGRKGLARGSCTLHLCVEGRVRTKTPAMHRFIPRSAHRNGQPFSPIRPTKSMGTPVDGNQTLSRPTSTRRAARHHAHRCWGAGRFRWQCALGICDIVPDGVHTEGLCKGLAYGASLSNRTHALACRKSQQPFT